MSVLTVASPRLLVSAVPRTPAPYGLFTVATMRATVDPHWQTGVEWQSEPCRQPGLIGPPDCDPSDSTGEGTLGLPKDFSDAGPGLDDASPFTLYAPWLCSPVGHSSESAEQQARDQLAAAEQFGVEHAIWSGQVDSQPSLADAEAVADGPLDPLSALATLEQQFSAQIGSQGVLHCSRYAATILVKQADLVAGASRLTTPLGTPVISGSGYGDPHPERLVITPPPFVYRGEVFTSSDRTGDLFDRDHNDLYAIAERTYLVGWDSCPTSLYADIEYPA